MVKLTFQTGRRICDLATGKQRKQRDTAGVIIQGGISQRLAGGGPPMGVASPGVQRAGTGAVTSCTAPTAEGHQTYKGRKIIVTL